MAMVHYMTIRKMIIILGNSERAKGRVHRPKGIKSLVKYFHDSSIKRCLNFHKVKKLKRGNHKIKAKCSLFKI